MYSDTVFLSKFAHGEGFVSLSPRGVHVIVSDMSNVKKTV